MPTLEVVAQLLPIELFANIIDYLAESPKSLGSCALVCHSWRSYAQANLFNTLLLDGCDDEMTWRASCLIDGTTIHCLYVETLYLNDAGWYEYEPIDINTIVLLVQNLPRLKSLAINIRLQCDIEDQSYVTPTLSLNKLSIYNNGFDDLKSIIRLLMSFSSIKHVHINSCWIESLPDSLEDLPILHHLRVASLSVAGRNLVPLLLQRLLQPTLTMLDSLDIEIHNLADVDVFTSVVHDAAPQLQSFALKVALSKFDPHLAEACWTAFGFPRFHVLQSMKIVIDGQQMRNTIWNLYTGKIICGLVSYMPATLQVLTLKLKIPYQYNMDNALGQLKEIDWISIDIAIGNISNLKSVVLEIAHYSSWTTADVWQKCITESLPKVHAMGLLRFKLPRRRY